MAAITQRLARLWRHRWAESDVERAFPPQTLQRLEQLVQRSESQHTGQIRLCVEGGLPYSYIWRDATARERAVGLFGKLRTWDTEHNNGVLIYLLLADHAIEIIADRALSRAVPTAQWDAVIQALGQAFQQQAYAQGLEDAVLRVSALLTTHFPPPENASGLQADDLPNAPVVQGRYRKDR